MVGAVIIYSGNEYTVISETKETFFVLDENGDPHVIPKTAAVEKYGTIKSAFPWGLIAAAAVGAWFILK